MGMHGMNLIDVRKLWKEYGGTVEDKNRTGEEVYSHTLWLKPITVNKRRKDAPRELTKALSKLMDA